jgi:acetyl-CoA carboxylase biotin carboxyl carrier protein
MIDLAFLKRLIEIVEASDIDTLEISRWATKIRISKSPAAILSGNAASTPVNLRAEANPAVAPPGAAPPSAVPPDPAAAEGVETVETAKLVEVTSPMVGTFYRAPAPDADPYVDVGDHVKVGQTLCILEAMKLMNELEAEVAGTIVKIAVENAEPVEYGQVLFYIQPD